jgi:hypothetical protein
MISRMDDGWTTVKAADVRPGDVARVKGVEFEVARVDDPFLGNDVMVCLIEDTPVRWHAYPARKDVDVEIRRSGA